MRTSRLTLRQVATYAAVSGLYLLAFVAADAVSTRFSVRTGVSVFYLPPGITLGLLLGAGLRYAPVVPLAPLLVGGYLHPLPTTTAQLLLIELSLSACYVVTAWVLTRMRPQLATAKGMAWFIGVAGLGGPLLNAVVVVLEFTRIGLVPASEELETTTRFWIGDSIGVLTLTPILLLATQGATRFSRAGDVRNLVRRWRLLGIAEIGVQIALAVACVWFVFRQDETVGPDLLHLSFLPVIWMAMRHALLGAAVGVTVTSFASVFWQRQEAPGEVQLFLITLAVTGLLLGAVVAERAGATDEARRQAAQLSALIQSTTDLVYLKDPVDLRYVTVNGQAAAYLGMAATEMIGKTDFDLFEPEVAEALRAADRAVLESDVPVTIEEAVPRTAHGARVMLSSKSVCRTTDGQVLGLLGISRDITARIASQRELQSLADERKRLLDRLVQAQQDERARIAENVHDDSVQALAAVELRLGLLHRQISERAVELLPGVEKLRVTISEATARLRQLLFDLESPADQLDLATALRQAAAHVFEDSETRWRVVGEPEVELPPAARVTAYRVAKEALVNAHKHARARNVDVSLRRDGSGVEVTVADDGVGIDLDLLKHVPGHLGVAHMEDQVNVASGWIRFEAPLTGGTTVRCWLPA